MRRHQFELEVDRVLEDLPQWVFEQVDNLIVVVEDEPSDDLGDVLGVYEGVSLAERSEYYSGALPDRIVVFYKPHIELGLPEDGLRSEIRRTVLHELAHHLGIDDDRLTELGWD